MLKFEKRQILKNVGSSWSALAVNVMVGIFLWPFILHHLGDAAFGIWVLIFSVTGYYGLFNLGIRSSIIRYVSKYAATDDREKLAQFVNTALFTYTGIGVVSMVLTALLSSSVEHFFKIPPEMHSQARLLLLMVGASVSLGFPLGVFGGMLEGLQRFYILNWTSIGATLARAALIVYFLNRGYGLLTVALLTVALPLLSSTLRGIIVFRLCPVPLGLQHVDRASFRDMANYGGTTFVVMIALRLRFRTDELVLGAMMSTVAVTYFNIGSRIVDYAAEFIGALAQVFVPMSSQSEATGDLARVRKIYLAGNRACALMMSQAASGRVLFGLGIHQTWAVITVIEGVANLILSIALVPPLGIIGDALGTAIPLSFTYLVFLPRHLKKQIGVPVGTFWREAYTLPVLLTLPLVAMLWLANRIFYPRNLIQLVLEVVAASSIYGVGLFWAYRTNRAFHVAEIAGLAQPSPPEPPPQAVVSVEYRSER